MAVETPLALLESVHIFVFKVCLETEWRLAFLCDGFRSSLVLRRCSRCAGISSIMSLSLAEFELRVESLWTSSPLSRYGFTIVCPTNLSNLSIYQARIAEEAGACAVMALERVPADIRAEGGVARMVNQKSSFPNELAQAHRSLSSNVIE